MSGGDEREVSEYAGDFLNHSPRRRGEVSRYNKLSPDQLAKAVAWLGEQLGLVEPQPL